MANSQPLPYAIALAVIAFIAVEGLAVYLVGAAAKTGNGWLWFFSGCFALFFTYAHVVEANTNNSVISEYITIAVPFFVVVGYWARTIKADIENAENEFVKQRENELARKQRIEDEERARKQKIEDDRLAHEREIERLKLEQDQAQKLAEIEVQKLAQLQAQNSQKQAQNSQMDLSLTLANQSRQSKKQARQNAIIDLVNSNPELKPTELTRRLNELGHDTSVSTVKRDLRVLNGAVKNG